MGTLENKVVVITGGSSGVGLAAAHRMRAEGAHVALRADRSGRDGGSPGDRR